MPAGGMKRSQWVRVDDPIRGGNHQQRAGNACVFTESDMQLIAGVISRADIEK